MKKSFVSTKKGNRSKKLWVVILSVLALLTVLVLATVYAWYQINIRPKDAAASTTRQVTIRSGLGADNIADLLEDKGLIRSSTAFSWFASREGVKGSLKAGTYEFSSNQSVSEIVGKLVKGDVAKRTLTFTPGRRLAQLRSVFLEAGFKEEDVDRALDTAGRKALDGIIPDDAT